MKFLEPMIVAFSMYSKIPMPRIECTPVSIASSTRIHQAV